MNKSGLAANNTTDSSLGLAEFSGLMQPLVVAGNPLAVAVSGGADSMALLLLCAQYVCQNGSNLTALTVDHGLRPEAAEEAKQVKKWCAERQIEHHTLVWTPPALTRAIQASARDARYSLLTEYCTAHHIPFLLTAHHRDDQTETLFFRLARGSGLDGLACMAPAKTLTPEVTLLRPLLCVPKSRLLATLATHEQDWIEDPSNTNPDFTRPRIRAQLAACQNAEDISKRAYAVSLSLLKFRKLLEDNTVSRITDCVSQPDEHSLSINTRQFCAMESEYGLRTLSWIGKRLGGRTHNPRTEKRDRFYDELLCAIESGKNTRLTFAGCLFHIQPKTQTILVTPEMRRVS